MILFRCQKCGNIEEGYHPFKCSKCGGLLLECQPQAASASSDGLAAPSGNPELAARPLAAPKSDSGQVYRKQIRRLQEQNKLLAECLADERGRRKRAYEWYQNRLHSRLWTIFDITMMGLRRWPDAGPARASERGAANADIRHGG